MSERATRLIVEWAKLREALSKSRPGDKYGSERLQRALEELDDPELRDVVVTVLIGSGAEFDRAESLHHVNENKADNRLENLRLMTRADHARLHRELEGGRKCRGA